MNIRKLISRTTGTFRSLKGVYVFNNILRSKALSHNAAQYKRRGFKKPVWRSVGYRDLKHLNTDELPWLDQPDALEKLHQHPGWTGFSADEKSQLECFIRDGYMIFRNFYSLEEVEALNTHLDELLDSGKVYTNYTGRKVMDAYRKSALIDQHYFRNERLLRIMSFALGRELIPFQTINFKKGSEQKAHSDSIHMSTQPPGFLIASWAALEKITEANGILFYYPGSHRLPYITCEDYESGNTRWTLGSQSYSNYESYIEALIQKEDLKPSYFYANPGDVLVWHANLLHGGSAIKDDSSTRKSMVCHYYGEDVICYHEISQRPALINKR